MAFSTSGENSDFTIGLTEPYFMGRDLSGSFDIFTRKDKSGDTTVNETGLSFGVGFAAARDVYHRLRYDLGKSKTSVSSTTATSETGEEGKSLLGSSVAYTLSKDTRDSRFDPTEGYFLELMRQFLVWVVMLSFYVQNFRLLIISHSFSNRLF